MCVPTYIEGDINEFYPNFQKKKNKQEGTLHNSSEKAQSRGMKTKQKYKE